jgi:Protein of unknown function (DUF1769)
MSRTALAIIRRLSPALQEDVTGAHPYLISPLAATAQALRVDAPGTEASHSLAAIAHIHTSRCRLVSCHIWTPHKLVRSLHATADAVYCFFGVSVHERGDNSLT